MTKPHISFLFFLFCVVFYNDQAMGQGKNADSTLLHQIETNTINDYRKAVGKHSMLYNGFDFEPYPFQSTTNANFKDTLAFTSGTVNYDGVVYSNIPLIYNIHKDLVLSLLYNKLFTYSLIGDKISEFDLLDHHFIRFYPDSLNKLMVEGFYDELYNAKLQVLSRYIKDLQTENNGSTITKVFTEKDTHFLKKGNTYYKVNSSGDFVNVLKDKKKELKKYIKDNKLNFRHDPDKAMIMVASYYDHLTN